MSWKRANLSRTHYSNIKMLHPDGTLMCRLSERRARWYLDRGLAVAESEDSLRLLFEPNGPGANGHPFYTAAHEDRCVVCGREECLSRHHCVPSCFRTHFPEEYKSHNWHDVLLLCDECHNEYEVHAQEVKLEMLQIPEDVMEERKSRLRAIKFAHTYAIHFDVIPKERSVPMLDEMRLYLGVAELTDDHILELALQERPCLICDDDWKAVVDRIDDLDEFIYWWRHHFVQTMNPQFLPEGWSVDSPTTNDRLDAEWSPPEQAVSV